MKLPILKCHGSGNDFILINEYEGILFKESERIILSKILGDRTGILGADGILFFQNSDCADGKMRMFNPDGSEAEMCGNGLRCIGRFAGEQLGKEAVLIETLKGTSNVRKDNPIHKGIPTYQAELSTISLNAKEIPIRVQSDSLINQPITTLSPHLKWTAVSMPNPHLVAIVDNLCDKELEQIGEQANQFTELLPNGANINFCRILDKAAIFVRTYERGVGLTNSCGSGMSASALVSCLLGHCSYGESIDVYSKGGLVRCQPMLTAHQHHSVLLSGNATFIFSNTIEFDLPSVSPITQYFGQIFLEEIENYGRLMEHTEQALGVMALS